MVFFTNGVLTILLLLFSLHLRKGDCKYSQFNCQFDDSNYNFKNAYENEGLSDIQYGEEPGGAPGKMQTYFDIIESVYAAFLKPGLSLNGIDNYIQFYSYYKKTKDSEQWYRPRLSEYIQSYNYSIYPDEETVGNIVTLMRRIASNEPSLGAASYLVTASPFYKKFYDVKFDSPKECSSWKYDHVAGVIKLIEEKSARVGYVLLDPKHIDHPVMFMEDGEAPPLKRYGLPPIKDEWLTNIFNGPFDYSKALPVRLLWYPKSDRNYNKPQKNSNFIVGRDFNLAYFFKRPYCSFVEHTVKSTLIKPRRTLKKFSGIDHLSIEVVAENVLVKGATKFHAYFESYADENQESRIFPTQVLEGKSPKSEVMASDITRLCTLLETKNNLDSCKVVWMGRMNDLEEISEDEDFLQASFSFLDRGY